MKLKCYIKNMHLMQKKAMIKKQRDKKDKREMENKI